MKDLYVCTPGILYQFTQTSFDLLLMNSNMAANMVRNIANQNGCQWITINSEINKHGSN